jgi:glycyl-tRNA synthetase
LAKNQNTSSGDLMDRLVALCKRRGIIFPSSEIYGGIGSAYDYGPPGVEMKNNLSRHWWREMTLKHENIVGLDSAIILHPRVWEASGHVEGFTDPLVECKACKGRFREDALVERLAERFLNGHKGKTEFDMEITRRHEEILRDFMLNSPPAGHEIGLRALWVGAVSETIIKLGRLDLQCPSCGAKGTLSEPRQFNLMFQTQIGAAADTSKTGYIRPETAQGIYLDYKTVQLTSRQKIPFGIAQIGKAFRNEITPGNFIFRTIEFEQMEMQFFIKPGENEKWLEYWKEQRWDYLLDLGINPAKLRWHRHEKLAHYARDAYDIEYDFPFGWSELEGLHDRGNYDLSRHGEFSKKDMSYFDDRVKERYIPHIIEASSGLNRALMMILCDAYREDVQEGEERVYLSLDPRLSPIKSAVMPLVNKDGIDEIADSLYRSLRGRWKMEYDDSGSIGKRYRRQDEIGTPFCFTVDYQTREDGTVTVRYRDTLQQERIGKDQIQNFLSDKLGAM